MAASYDHDFYSWAMEQAALLRSGRLAQVDIDHIAEEIETLGRSEAAALRSSYRVLLGHLLKWRYQSQRRSESWRQTIARERINIDEHLDDSPGLKPRCAELFEKAYGLARREAAAETGMPLNVFPKECPFPMDEAVSDDFWPEP
jgi:hypothetical protein